MVINCMISKSVPTPFFFNAATATGSSTLGMTLLLRLRLRWLLLLDAVRFNLEGLIISSSEKGGNKSLNKIKTEAYHLIQRKI